MKNNIKLFFHGFVPYCKQCKNDFFAVVVIVFTIFFILLVNDRYIVPFLIDMHVADNWDAVLIGVFDAAILLCFWIIADGKNQYTRIVAEGREILLKKYDEDMINEGDDKDE